jgi:hypothetical protein
LDCANDGSPGYDALVVVTRVGKKAGTQSSPKRLGKPRKTKAPLQRTKYNTLTRKMI